MEKRLFIALPLPKDALKVLEKYRDEMGRETPYLRWTPLQNLHITALFLGDAAEENIPRVVETVERIWAETKPFSLLCGGACYAPPQRPPSMVWLWFSESRQFFRFAKRLADTLTPLAPALNWEPYKTETPHVTLARFQKSIPPQRLRRLRRIGLEGVGVPISSCKLVESQLTASGPIYRTLGRYTLGA